MIQEFVKAWDARKGEVEAKIRAKHPGDYAELVRWVVEILSDEPDHYGQPDPKRIHSIDDGDYQGTLLFVIGAGGYQPDEYWFVKVGYGSCSGCDTLQGISGYSYDPPTEEQVSEYMTLALHILQGLKPMQSETI